MWQSTTLKTESFISDSTGFLMNLDTTIIIKKHTNYKLFYRKYEWHLPTKPAASMPVCSRWMPGHCNSSAMSGFLHARFFMVVTCTGLLFSYSVASHFLICTFVRCFPKASDAGQAPLTDADLQLLC